MPFLPTLPAGSVDEATVRGDMVGFTTAVTRLTCVCGRGGVPWVRLREPIHSCCFGPLQRSCVALCGFHALGKLLGFFEGQFLFGQKAFLSTLVTKAAHQPIPQCFVEILPEIAIRGQTAEFCHIHSHTHVR